MEREPLTLREEPFPELAPPLGEEGGFSNALGSSLIISLVLHALVLTLGAGYGDGLPGPGAKVGGARVQARLAKPRPAATPALVPDLLAPQGPAGVALTPLLNKITEPRWGLPGLGEHLRAIGPGLKIGSMAGSPREFSFLYAPPTFSDAWRMPLDAEVETPSVETPSEPAPEAASASEPQPAQSPAASTVPAMADGTSGFEGGGFDYYPADRLTRRPRFVDDPGEFIVRNLQGYDQGRLIVQLLVNAQGTVDSVKVEASELNPAETKIFEQRLRNIKLSPGELDGVPVKARWRLEFSLEPK